MVNVVYPNEEVRIEQGCAVTLHFSVALENGVEIDNTRQHDAPVQLVVGDGNLLPGFDNALLGLKAGDRRTIHLPPEDAFGTWNPDNVQYFDTVKFEDLPVEGNIIEFEDKAKASVFGVVKSVNADIIEVDFNHPLAGKNITFAVEVFKVTPSGQQAVQLV